MNNTELKALCESVGRTLTGKPVQVRFRQPAYKDARGTACRRGRTAVLDIKPGLNSETFLDTLLKEIAHVKTLWGSWTISVPDFEPGSLRLPAIYKTSPENSFIENEAERLAGEWFQFANEYADNYSGSWLAKRLQALEDKRKIEMAALVDRAVERGIEKAMDRVRENWK